MMEGLQLQQKLNRQQTAEMMHLQRMIVLSIQGIANSFSKNPKKMKIEDIWPIPEIDEVLEKARKREKEEFEKRADRALNKYRNLVT